MKFMLCFRSGTPPIAWGKPDSPVRPLCAICAGPLTEVPLMMWKADGSAASFCDQCVEKYITTEKR
ncbi:MAG TPA: hypothetical protein VKG24_21045 [Pseudolabrys sp.]|nr:hypothetical protein [Pseudolabrys sp.]